jgi:hypothetical protein
MSPRSSTTSDTRRRTSPTRSRTLRPPHGRDREHPQRHRRRARRLRQLPRRPDLLALSPDDGLAGSQALPHGREPVPVEGGRAGRYGLPPRGGSCLGHDDVIGSCGWRPNRAPCGPARGRYPRKVPRRSGTDRVLSCGGSASTLGATTRTGRTTHVKRIAPAPGTANDRRHMPAPLPDPAHTSAKKQRPPTGGHAGRVRDRDPRRCARLHGRR